MDPPKKEIGDHCRLIYIDQKVPARLCVRLNALAIVRTRLSGSRPFDGIFTVVSSGPLATSHEDLQEANQNEVLPMSLLTNS
jgi:hypothetical protein